MRRVSILVLATALAAACNGRESRIVEPRPCDPSVAQDTLFEVWTDSLRLVMGAADEAFAEWVTFACDDVQMLASSELTWTVRDPTVVAAEPTPHESPSKLLVPRAPGQTWVVVEAGARADSLEVTVPDTTSMGPSASIAAGGWSSCSVTDVGDVYCWGSGAFDLLGEVSRDPLVGTCWGSPCSPMPVLRASGAASVHAGRVHACLLTEGGSPRCWGANGNLQLGATVGPQSATPVDVQGSPAFVDLSLGSVHSCGLTDTGEAYCWGSHEAGRLGGNQRTGPVASPVGVSLDLRFSSIDARNDRTCGAANDGGLYCWGILPSTSALPATESCEIPGNKGSTFVSCTFVPLRMPLGSGHGSDSLFVEIRGDCGLSTAGSVSCLDPMSGVFERRTGFGPYGTLVAGEVHTCGLRSDGVAECWGETSSGALGDGTRQARGEPVVVAGGHTFAQLAAGIEHTCGRTVDDVVWCWGYNATGQVGVSVLLETPSPFRVRGQG